MGSRIAPALREACFVVLLTWLAVAAWPARADDDLGDLVSVGGREPGGGFSYTLKKDAQGSYYFVNAAHGVKAKPKQGEQIKYKNAGGDVVTVTQPDENSAALNQQQFDADTAMFASLLSGGSVVEVDAGDLIHPLLVSPSATADFAALDPALFGESGGFAALSFFDVFVDLQIDPLSPMFVLGSATDDGATPTLFHFGAHESFTLDLPTLGVIDDPNLAFADANVRSLLFVAVSEPAWLVPGVLALLALQQRRRFRKWRGGRVRSATR